LEEKFKITSVVSVCNNRIWLNGKLAFESKEPDVARFLLSAFQNLKISYPKFYKMDGLSKLGWIAAEYLLNDKPGFAFNDNFSAGMVLANKNASLDADLKYYQTVASIPSPALFVYTLPNIVMGEISIRHKLKGENAFFIQEEFDADFIAQYVQGLLNNNILQSCICGWVDLLNEDYKAVLMRVEKNGEGVEFTSQNMLTYF